MADNIVEEALQQAGRWGKFQIYYFTCLGLVMIFSGFPMSYIFTARDVKYRCHISECENSSTATYNPEWLVDFVHYKESPSSCFRFAMANNTCTKAAVIKNETVKCDTFIYQRGETTIVHDFNITCEENLWKLTIVGTINFVGDMLCLPFSGFLSDRYGRKPLMIMSVLLSTAIGIIRSFSPNYMAYIFLEFLNTALGGGMNGAAMILAMEMVGPKERNKGSTIICSIYALGQAYLGLAAWLAPSWRIMLRVLYVNGLITVIYFWILPESIRWLFSVNRKEEARAIVVHIAKINGKKISKDTLDKLMAISENEIDADEAIEEHSFVELIKCKALLLRMLHCAFTWISVTFVYYGLTIHSVAISDNIYLSFIFTVVIEIPGYVIYCYVNERVGRRLMLFMTSILSGIFCVSVGFIPGDYFWVKLCAFLAGKCCSTMASAVLFLYTTEMFPTNSRHLTFSICLMVGRLGAMGAPQVPLLARISKTLPLLMFGCIACTSGSLALLFPETLNINLPDTVEQAVNIGKNGKKYKYEETSQPLKS